MSLRWFINVGGGVYLVRVSLILIGPQQGLGHFFRYILASHWLKDCANFTPNAGGKRLVTLGALLS